MQVDSWSISIVLLQNTGYSDFHSSIFVRLQDEQALVFEVNLERNGIRTMVLKSYNDCTGATLI